MPRPIPDWYADAVERFANGQAPKHIAEALGVNVASVYHAVNPKKVEKRAARFHIRQHRRIDRDDEAYLELKPHHWLSIYMRHKAAGRENAAALADAEVKAQRGQV